MITFGSVASGIEAASVAWGPLHWRALWLSEIADFPSRLLAHRYPHTINLGDMTRVSAMIRSGEAQAPEVLVGGTPCQSFSVAGLRGGLSDERGSLTLTFVHIADAIDEKRRRSGQRPCVALWENVPGVLSSKDNAFGCFLGALSGEDDALQPPGTRWADAGCVFGPTRTVAWRILDAQYFGVAQRRRRVFVVASSRADFDPTEVLFEREGVRRDSAPSRSAPEDITGTFSARTSGGGGFGTDFECSGGLQPVLTSPNTIAHCLNAGGMGRIDYETETFVVHGTQDPCENHDLGFPLGRNNGGENVVFCREVAQTLTSNYGKQLDNSNTALGPNVVCVTGDITHALKAEGFDASEDGLGRGQPIIAFTCKDYGADAGELAPTLRAMGHTQSHANGGGQVAVCMPYGVSENVRSELRLTEVIGALTSSGGGKPGQGRPVTLNAGTVRRLTPVECERLQAFPDKYTAIPVRGKPAADGPRYRALGNSMCVNVVRWLGQRIQDQLYPEI